MATRVEAARKFVEAQTTRDDAAIKEVGGLLAAGAVMGTPRGSLEGRDAILDRLRNPPQGPAAGMLGQLTWRDPIEEGDRVKLVAELPPGLPLPIKGLELSFGFDDDGAISRVDLTPQR